MVNRDNYHVVNQYLDYLTEVRQLDRGSVVGYWTYFKYLLEYAGPAPFYDLETKRPTLPEYLRTVKGMQNKKIIIPRTQARALAAYKDFYAWAKMYKKGGYLKVTEIWLDTLRPRIRDMNASKEYKEHIFWSLEEVKQVARMPAHGDFEERARAAICFLFLSGMRAGAFCSLPVDCVDIQARRIEQKPSRGVVTKNRKSAVTTLLPIPELLEVVEKWDTRIRKAGCKNWFPPLTRQGLIYVLSNEGNEDHRLIFSTASLAMSIHRVCENLNMPYKSPHKLRHGHGVYGLKNAKNIEELKALSQNMMHENIGITDGLYGKLPEEDVRQVLSTFQANTTGKDHQAAGDMLTPELINQLARLIAEQMSAKVNAPRNR